MEAECDALKKLLEESGVTYKVLTHERVFTSQQAAEIRGVPLSSGVKAMIVKAKDDFLMVLVPGDRKIGLKKLKGRFGSAKLATHEEVFRITGCEVGSVHPFGQLFGLRVLMDRHILDSETVNFNAGLHEVSINMSPRDMAEIIKPELGDFAE